MTGELAADPSPGETHEDLLAGLAAEVPPAVREGTEPLRIVGAIAGG
jgi:hypothetical protein